MLVAVAAAVVAVVAVVVADVVAVDAAVSAAPNGGLTPHIYIVCTTLRVDFGCARITPRGEGKRLPHGGCCTKKGADGEKKDQQTALGGLHQCQKGLLGSQEPTRPQYVPSRLVRSCLVKTRRVMRARYVPVPRWDGDSRRSPGLQAPLERGACPHQVHEHGANRLGKSYKARRITQAWREVAGGGGTAHKTRR